MSQTLLEKPVEDHTLAHRVHFALERSPHFSGRKLRFEAEDGRVTLHGVVPSYYQKQMAQEALLRVAGVDRVENQLQVHWA
jgi:osmotically-inducible protein OsmY